MNNKLHIGYHESVSDGFEAMGKEALAVGADTFAFFTRNPRGGKSKELNLEDVERLNALMKDNNFAPLVAHAPYTMNPCSADEGLRKYAYEMMVDDLLKLQNINGCFYNFHPGSHVGQGSEKGIDLTSTFLCESIKTINEELSKKGEIISTKILIETMSGKGSEIGRNFEEVKSLVLMTEEKIGQDLSGILGVCLDTCHIWDGGYDIVNSLDDVVEHFDSVISLKRLHAIHLNDSMNELDTHKDRHEKIGEGKIGFDALCSVINHPKLHEKPFILETPNDQNGYKKEIEMLRNSFKY
jgi:deoxyribonuclease IV